MQSTIVQRGHQAAFQDEADSRLRTLVPQHFRIVAAHLRQIIKLLTEHPRLHPNAFSVSADLARLIPLLEAMNHHEAQP